MLIRTKTRIVEPVFAKYSRPTNNAIMAQTVGGENWGSFTINPLFALEKNEVCVKNPDANADYAESLIAAELIKPEPSRTVKIGFTSYRVYVFTDEGMKQKEQ